MRQQNFDFIEHSSDGRPDEHTRCGRASQDEIARLMGECIGAVARAVARNRIVPTDQDPGPVAGRKESDHG